MFTLKWTRKQPKQPEEQPEPDPTPGPVLIHALEGFLSAGNAPNLAVEVLLSGHGEVVHRFDVDSLFDYRARRPRIKFVADHYLDYETPQLEIVREVDRKGQPYLVLAGPEPDYAWDRFAREVADVVTAQRVRLTLGLGAVPMGVPHTRPPLVTAHGTRPGLIEHENLWKAELEVPSSAQSVLEYRLGQWGHDAGGFVAHVPSYVVNTEYPTAARALLEAALGAADLEVSIDALVEREAESMDGIERHIAENGAEELVRGLEEQFDAFSRGLGSSLLADGEELPSGEELARQFEAFLAQETKGEE